MKKIAVFSLVVLVLSCAGKQDLSPSETAKIVAESFYHGDKATLKKYTTESGNLCDSIFTHRALKVQIRVYFRRNTWLR